ncbi:MAG: YbjN domain-containing protein [Thermomicrobiales bacterium]
MAIVAPISLSLVGSALDAGGIRHVPDDDGDLKITFSREKGKDVTYFVFGSATEQGFLSSLALVHRYFKEDREAYLIRFCNTWNRERRMPRAYVVGPDDDGDYTVRLDMQILCSTGVTEDFVLENLTFFITGAILFWDELDEVT